MQLFIILSLVRICWLTFAAVNFSCSPSSLVFKCVCFCEGGVQPTPSFFCFCVSLQQNVNAQQKAVFPIAFCLDSAEKPDLLLCQNFHKDKARLNYAQMCPHFVCVCHGSHGDPGTRRRGLWQTRYLMKDKRRLHRNTGKNIQTALTHDINNNPQVTLGRTDYYRET